MKNKPAFPCYERGAITGFDLTDTGMTLRDYFAAHAPEPPDWWRGGDKNVGDVVAWKWRYADAMLEARE
jgi:hypothetical protein